LERWSYYYQKIDTPQAVFTSLITASGWQFAEEKGECVFAGSHLAQGLWSDRRILHTSRAKDKVVEDLEYPGP
jgi:hypothetical protein